MPNTITLPPAVTRSSHNHLTVRNNSLTEILTINAAAGDSIGSVFAAQFPIRVATAVTLQSDGVDRWWPISSYKPNAGLFESDLSADTEITTALTLFPGTTQVLNYPLLFYWSSFWRLDVSAVPGNQTWDVDLGVYDVTDAAWIFSFDMAGSGNPDSDIFRFVSAPLDVPADAVGHVLQMAAIRTTTTGTIWARTGGGNDTGHTFTGPL